jgi:hypothetical protein
LQPAKTASSAYSLTWAQPRVEFFSVLNTLAYFLLHHAVY